MGEIMQPLSQRQIWNALSREDTGPFGANAHYYPVTGSTSDVARELAAGHAPEGTLVVADEQTAGRGRMGRRWEAPPRTSLLMSVIFRPRIPADQIYRLVMVCGLAVAEACEDVTGVTVAVKWPNDLLIGGRKVAGILPESAFTGESLSWVVVGMGINVNQVFEKDAPLAETATSLRVVIGGGVDRAALLAKIMARMNHWNACLGDDALDQAWQGRCLTIGQRVRIQLPGETIEGLAEALDAAGALWLRDEVGVLHRIVAGEATLLNP
jgi:BirA family biotin operon repressor/biotin-[acetyl-CoA-carboxylase] ligase